MLLKNMMSNLATFKAENRLLKFSVVIIGIAIVVNTLMVFSALNYERVILIPRALTNRYPSMAKQRTNTILVFLPGTSPRCSSHTPREP